MEWLVGLGITSDTMDKASISSRGSYDRQSTLRVCRTSRLQNEYRTSYELDTGEVGPFSAIDWPARVPMGWFVGLGITSDTMDKASRSSRGSYDRQPTLRVCPTPQLPHTA